mmetsp:Transcript_4229/g.8547  ORF Transcript_4229/g.8547 Transcript_4229/m.8547 type:complete len:200 (-) Transcript_4229:328-927(-)|eukprot:CAMPEP_0181297938 /NCGR_PEP_ID=MMETSP1101-20121128/5513_1 /TAXON_ID=46948 /ORGANISM="Rhodomonas abbreviata, Strain Caron Lab Isolate" /LENGTH=199 /DNA_ID=CAMNT_0023402921 /DNA_START=184 /DNA_END=783 /DNA_ORIENTATION=-
MAHINAGTAKFYASWVENGLLADLDRKNGRVGPRGELLRKRPIQTSLHTVASPRLFMEREGVHRPREAFASEHKVDYLVAKMTNGKELQSPRALKEQHPPCGHRDGQFQSIFTRVNKIKYGDAMIYATRIAVPHMDIKNRPITGRDHLISVGRPPLSFAGSQNPPEFRVQSRMTASSSSKSQKSEVDNQSLRSQMSAFP